MRWLKITELGKNNADPGAELLVGTEVTELSRHHWSRSNTGTGSFGVRAAEQCRTEDC